MSTKAATELFNRFLLFARKKLAKMDKEGIMRVPNDEQAKALANETIAKFTTYKVPPSSLNTADDIAMIDNQITNIEQNKLVNEIKKNLTPKKDNVIDITDKMPSPFENLDKAVKEGNFMGIKNQVLKDKGIADEFMKMKKFPTRTAEGEEAIPLAMKAKFDEEVPYKPLSDEDYSVDKLVKDFKKFGKATDKDIQTILTSGKAGQIPYVMSERGMSYSEVLDTLKKGKPLIEGIDKIKKADGGRAGYSVGGLMKILKAISEVSPLQAYKNYMKNVKTRAQKGDVKSLAPELGAVAGGGIFVNRRMSDILENMKNQDMENNLENFKKELNQDPFYKEYPDIKDKVLENYIETMFGEKKADGGRIGLKDGMDRRKFMKIMGGLATLPFVGKFFKGAKTAAPMAEKAAETVTQAPSYFFDLVSKIKIFGKQRQTPSYKDRVNEYTYTGKDGIEYDLIEDLDTGEIKITKDKIGGRNYGDESYEVIEDRTEMVFKKGQADETTKGKKPPDEYEEYKVEFDQDGTAADASEIDELSKSEIIKEVSGDAPSIKKASGGIAGMLGE